MKKKYQPRTNILGAILFLGILVFGSACDSGSNSGNNSGDGAATTYKSSVAEAGLKGEIEWMEERKYSTWQGAKDGTYSALYYYNEAGNWTHATTYGRKNSFTGKYVYEHDADGNITGAKKLTEAGTVQLMLKYQYDSPNKRLTVASYAAEGNELYAFTTSTFDDKGNEISASIYGADSALLHKTTSKWDTNGFLVETEKAEPDGVVEIRMTYINDENGNPVETKIFDGHVGHYSNTHTYEFDDRGNWIKQESFMDGQPVEMTERVIKYKE